MKEGCCPNVGAGFVLCLVSCALWPVHAVAGEPMRLAGVGTVMASSPYRGVDSKARVLPFVRWTHKNFYIKGVEFGCNLYKTEEARLSAMVLPRFMGYHSSDSEALRGMDNRRNSVDAGLAWSHKIPGIDGGSADVRLVADIGGVHDGQEATVSIAKKIPGTYCELTPSLGARMQTRRMTNYYYGIRDGEAMAGRAAYRPGTAVNYFGDVMFNFGIHPKWIVITKVGVEFLDREITKSPIVNKDFLVTGVIGLTRKF